MKMMLFGGSFWFCLCLFYCCVYVKINSALAENDLTSYRVHNTSILSNESSNSNELITNQPTFLTTPTTQLPEEATFSESNIDENFDSLGNLTFAVNITRVVKQFFSISRVNKQYYSVGLLQRMNVSHSSSWKSEPVYILETSAGQNHLTARSVNLQFDFPFYGHPIRQVTIATGGFLYMSDFIHQYLTYSQFVAPFMANFNPSLSPESSIFYRSETEKFMVEWKNIPLNDAPTAGLFWFQVILHKSGIIMFIYKSIPLQISEVVSAEHPFKIGIADAYYVDTVVKLRQKKLRQIYVYHEISMRKDHPDWVYTNSTIIFVPHKTCNTIKTCEECLKARHPTQQDTDDYDDLKMGATFSDSSGGTSSNVWDQPQAFQCRWCGRLGTCSSGTDRNRQAWVENGCESQVNSEMTLAQIQEKIL